MITISAAALCASAALLPVRAVAQESDSWQFRAYLYGYFPRIDLSATFTGPGGIPISADAGVSASELLQHLKMGFLGALEAQKGNWGAFTDVLYLNVGGLNSQSHIQRIGGIGLPVDATASTSFDLKGTAWTLAGSYRVIAQPDSSLDVLAGARLLDVKSNLGYELSGNIGPIPLPGRQGSADVSKSVWDAILGVKGHFGLSTDQKWFLPYYLDVGTGDTRLTWQGIGGIGYAYSWGELTAVWRYLDFKGKSSQPIDNLSFNGPMVGVSFRF